MSNHPYEGIPLLLLSGVGRSGTAAVREALGRHPQIDSTGRENNILYDVLDAAARNCTASSRRFAMRVDDATYDACFRRLVLDLLWPAPRAAPPRRLLAFTALTPDRADYARRVFKDARIIFLVRNGIEVVSSRLRHPSFADHPFAWHCDCWSESAQLARWGESHRDFLLIRHESLLRPGSLARTLQQVWSLAGLAPEPACADHLLGVCHHPTGDAAGTASPAQLLRNRRDRWRDWTGGRRRIFTERCGDAMRYFGYPIPWEIMRSRRQVECQMLK